MKPVIEISKLYKSYGDFMVVRDLSLTIEHGEIFAILGPNGAGKTTTVEILEGFRRADSGSITVLDTDPSIKGRAGLLWRDRIGIVLQSTQDTAELSALEALTHFASYYSNPRDPREVIELVGLGDKADARARSLSGGQRRRLDVALGIIGNPELLFLDEPTSGMDPFSRRARWKLIKEYQPGRCIVFTTHYMDEADILGDTVAVLSHGSLRVSGSPLFLKRRFGCGYTLSVLLPQIGTVDAQKSVDDVMAKVRRHVPSAAIVMQEGQEVIINLSAESFASFPGMLLALDESRASSDIRDYGISLTSLEEVFMRIEDDGSPRPPPKAAVSEHNSVESVPVDLEANVQQAAWDGAPDGATSLLSETPVSELGEPAPSRRRKTIDRAEKKCIPFNIIVFVFVSYMSVQVRE